MARQTMAQMRRRLRELDEEIHKLRNLLAVATMMAAAEIEFGKDRISDLKKLLEDVSNLPGSRPATDRTDDDPA